MTQPIHNLLYLSLFLSLSLSLSLALSLLQLIVIYVHNPQLPERSWGRWSATVGDSELSAGTPDGDRVKKGSLDLQFPV